jgi:hypothetical protein
MQETALRSKQDKTDRDHRLILLESECGRLKTLVSKSDTRVEELERLRQTDRTKILELRDQVNTTWDIFIYIYIIYSYILVFNHIYLFIYFSLKNKRFQMPSESFNLAEQNLK